MISIFSLWSIRQKAYLRFAPWCETSSALGGTAEELRAKSRGSWCLQLRTTQKHGGPQLYRHKTYVDHLVFRWADWLQPEQQTVSSLKPMWISWKMEWSPVTQNIKRIDIFLLRYSWYYITYSHTLNLRWHIINYAINSHISTMLHKSLLIAYILTTWLVASCIANLN